MESYTEKRNAKILPTVTKLELKAEEKKTKEPKTGETKPLTPADQSTSSSSSEKVAGERVIELKNGQIIPQTKLVTVNTVKEVQKIQFQYRRLYLPKKAYIVTVDEVFEGYENFSTAQVDYEIKDVDIEFLEQSGLGISNEDFEKAIDCFEKVSKIMKSEALQKI